MDTNELQKTQNNVHGEGGTRGNSPTEGEHASDTGLRIPLCLGAGAGPPGLKRSPGWRQPERGTRYACKSSRALVQGGQCGCSHAGKHLST